MGSWYSAIRYLNKKENIGFAIIIYWLISIHQIFLTFYLSFEKNVTY